MDSDNQPLDPKLFELVALAVEEGLARVRELIEQKKYIGSYSTWPAMHYFKSGLPFFTEKPIFTSPTRYEAAFGFGPKSQINVEEINSFQALITYIESHQRLMEYYLPVGSRYEDMSESSRRMAQYDIISMSTNLIGRYIHIFGDARFDLEKLRSIYLPLEFGLLEKNLPIDIVIPILFLRFDFDSVSIADNISLEKMEDSIQLARALKRASAPSIHDSVIGAATHALVLHNWVSRSENYWSNFNAESDPSPYPLKDIDDFFTAIRIATNLDTGYAQLLVRPIGWAQNYRGNLPELKGTSTRKYPMWFEHYYWLRDVPTVDLQTATQIGEVYSKVTNIESNRFILACRRFNLWLLREDEEDSILDATIAMETLLSDDNNQEMTHKLALRMSALSQLSNQMNQKPSEVFKAIKHIYNYRSAIVHGNTKASKKREIVLDDQTKVPAVSLAIQYLRMALGVLIDHPRYLNQPTKIDEELLLDRES